MREHRITLGGLDTVVVEPATGSATNIIMLHGYSMSPAALSPFAHSLGVDATFYFPQAPHAAMDGGWTWWHVDKDKRAKALAQGPRDLANTSPDRQSIREQMLRFVREVSQCEPCQTVLAGFSQGGMLSLDLYLMEEIQIDALALFSACLIDEATWRPRTHKLSGVPTIISHGSRDRDLAFEAGCRLRDFLVSAGAQVSWSAFEGGHEIPLTVWRDFKQLVKRLEQRRI
jgi:phospholipase/carboxylesterase